jgi:hypothetical protein
MCISAPDSAIINNEMEERQLQMKGGVQKHH